MNFWRSVSPSVQIPLYAVASSIRFHVRVCAHGSSCAYFSPPCEQTAPSLCFFMSLAEIEKAVVALPPEELTRLAAYIAWRDKHARDEELEEDSYSGGKHERAVVLIDIVFVYGNFTSIY